MRVATHRWALGICAGLLVVFACLSYSAALTKNATIDEPTHALAGWCALRQGDFAVETVNPPLWKCWAALGNLFSEPVANHAGRVFAPGGDVGWSSRVLYGTAGLNGAAFINRARAMMLVLGIVLGGLVARWSWGLAGPVAAIVSTFLFCFDPNFIAHSAVVKSDVALGLVLLGFSRAVWQFGNRATAGGLGLVGVLCGIAINVKFSGVIVGPMLAVMLLYRAMTKEKWEFCGKMLLSRPARLGAGIVSGLVAAVCCVGVTWACYGFNAGSPQSTDMSEIYAKERLVGATVELNRAPTQAELDKYVPGITCRFVKWAADHRILPTAMLAGFLYQHACVELWPAFLNGELYGDGRWYYFPLAMIYKTPIAELFAIGVGIILLGLWGYRSWRGLKFETLWAVVCLSVVFTVFAIAAMGTRLNIGFRNALPLMPFLQIACGCAAAIAWRRMRRWTIVLLAVIAVGLCGETLCAWPDYIAFFNVAAGGKSGGIRLLADSNLDWGQDVNLLVKWKKEHPDVPLIASLFTGVDPIDLGLRVESPVVNPKTGREEVDPKLQSWVLAVSATHLQGLYDKREELPFFRSLLLKRPMEVLGGTIYLYRFERGQSH